MKSTLLAILAANQSFDATLQTTPGIDRIIARYRQQIIDQLKAEKRNKIIALLAASLVDYYRDTVQPAAAKIATANALAVISKIHSDLKPDLTNTTLRRQILHEMDLRAADRLKIIRSAIDDKANTLENRLTAYHLEPGRTPEQKLARLRELDKKSVDTQAKYSDELTSFYRGERDTRPARPRLDFTARLTQDARDAIREQARRAGTEAETAAFVDQGYEQFAWITVNSSEACPDCRKRQGVVGNTKFWDQLGRPGSGETVCGSACFCLLVPSGILIGDPSLSAGINSRVGGVLTTESQAVLLNEHRPGLN